ncbi:MAG: hypothetical protein NTV03_00220 [Candidatus Nomurabacteria bacterium]|nr:hypothetical protein [Candidatus Nomurabacteria bacterium]
MSKIRRKKKPSRRKRKELLAKHLADKIWSELLYLPNLNKST